MQVMDKYVTITREDYKNKIKEYIEKKEIKEIFAFLDKLFFEKYGEKV